MAVQEEVKQAPVKLNKETSGKVTKLIKTQKGSSDYSNKQEQNCQDWLVKSNLAPFSLNMCGELASWQA